MGTAVVAPKRRIGPRTKTKTGCGTCRIRKVKCDEKKPSCDRCIDTGRTCDGYESPFRLFTSLPIDNTHAGVTKLEGGLQPMRTKITPQDISLLNRYFSTKTIFDVDVCCNEEASQVLQASLADPPLKHAVLSLRALRQDFETSGDGPASAARQNPSYNYGVQQYCMALGGLASTLSSPGSNGLQLVLLCCQVFISIEQVRENYAAMAQHIIRGLGIMHGYRARPSFVAANKLVPAQNSRLAAVDVFVIKLFAAPCKFAEPPATVDLNGIPLPLRSIPPHQHPDDSSNLRKIVPNVRTELTRIAASTLEFLGKVSAVRSVDSACQLLAEKAALLDALGSWLIDVKFFLTEIAPSGPESLSIAFMRFFHVILKVVLMGALDSSPSVSAELRTENARLQEIANNISERVKDYRTWHRTVSGRGNNLR